MVPAEFAACVKGWNRYHAGKLDPPDPDDFDDMVARAPEIFKTVH